MTTANEMTTALQSYLSILERTQATTDLGNAYRLQLAFGDRIRHAANGGGWHVWNGTRWRRDTTKEIFRLAAQVSEQIRTSAEEDDVPYDRRGELMKWARQSQFRSRIHAMVGLAATLNGVAVEAAAFDAQPDLLNVRNGTFRLRPELSFEPHDPENLLTKETQAGFDRAAAAPTWEAFIATALPDPAVRSFVQRAVGYSLIGTVEEQVVFVLHGGGATGKSTFLEALGNALGDYAQVAPGSLLTGKSRDIPNDIARLRGARFVSIVETDEGAAWDAARFKQLSGGDTISARFLYEDWFDFRPSHTLWLATNHRPVADGADDAMWRRIRLVPFSQKVPEDERDLTLLSRLRDECDGILLWCLEGYVQYQAQGLRPPDTVKAATEHYRSESDEVGLFIDERCVVDPTLRVTATDLFRDYQWWAQERGERPMTKTALGRRLGDRFERVKSGHHYWVGLNLK